MVHRQRTIHYQSLGAKELDKRRKRGVVELEDVRLNVGEKVPSCPILTPFQVEPTIYLQYHISELSRNRRQSCLDLKGRGRGREKDGRGPFSQGKCETLPHPLSFYKDLPAGYSTIPPGAVDGLIFGILPAALAWNCEEERERGSASDWVTARVGKQPRRSIPNLMSPTPLNSFHISCLLFSLVRSPDNEMSTHVHLRGLDQASKPSMFVLPTSLSQLLFHSSNSQHCKRLSSSEEWYSQLEVIHHLDQGKAFHFES